MPRRHTSCAARPAISPPSKRIEPALSGKVPAIRLKIVVLPEPFGPMRPRISPGLTANDTPLTARNPPNRLARPATSSTLAPVPHVLFLPSLLAARCVAAHCRGQPPSCQSPQPRRNKSPGAQILHRLVAAKEIEQDAQGLAARARQPRVALEDQASIVMGDRHQL